MPVQPSNSDIMTAIDALTLRLSTIPTHASLEPLITSVKSCETAITDLKSNYTSLADRLANVESTQTALPNNPPRSTSAPPPAPNGRPFKRAHHDSTQNSARSYPAGAVSETRADPCILQLGPFPFKMTKKDLITQASTVFMGLLPENINPAVYANNLAKSATLTFSNPTDADNAYTTLNNTSLTWDDPATDPATKHTLHIRRTQTAEITAVKKALGKLYKHTAEAYRKVHADGPRPALFTHAPRRTLHLQVGLRVLDLFTINMPTPDTPLSVTQHIEDFDHTPAWLTQAAVQSIISASIAEANAIPPPRQPSQPRSS